MNRIVFYPFTLIFLFLSWNPVSYAQPASDTGFTQLRTKLEQFRRLEDPLGEANCLQEMGQLYYHLGNYSGALQ
mgnify:CR=1 FL=1